MRLLNAHISKIFIRAVLVLCLMFFWGQINHVDAQTFVTANIQGEYVFTAFEQGGGDGISGDALSQEAAMGIASYDGAGNVTGKVTWNMHDVQDLNPASDRLVLVNFPFTGTYTVETDGSGTASYNIDFDLDGNIDVVMNGYILITKERRGKALEFYFMADDTVYSATGGLPILRVFKR